MRSMIDAIRMEDKSKIQSLVKGNPDLLIAKFEGSSMYEKAVQFEKQDIAQLLHAYYKFSPIYPFLVYPLIFSLSRILNKGLHLLFLTVEYY